jgi:hypothetical protein
MVKIILLNWKAGAIEMVNVFMGFLNTDNNLRPLMNMEEYTGVDVKMKIYG